MNAELRKNVGYAKQKYVTSKKKTKKTKFRKP